MENKNELRTKYTAYSQSYDDGTRFLPKAAKIELFWETYPNGAIITPLPTKDITGEGILATCQVYRDAANKEGSLLADTYARRSSVQVQDAAEDVIDIYAAVQAEAVSKALALAGINISVDEIYKDVLLPLPKRSGTAAEELVMDSNGPVEEIVPPPAAPENSENSAEQPAVPEIEIDDIPEIPEPIVDKPASSRKSDNKKDSIAAAAISRLISEPQKDNKPQKENTSPVLETKEPVTKPALKSEPKVEPKPKPEPKTETKPASKSIPKPEPEPAPVVSENEETEESLIKETGKTYEEALNVGFRHQSRSGVLGDLLSDAPSKCLLKWMGDPNGTFRKKKSEMSKIARIVVLHNNL